MAITHFMLQCSNFTSTQQTLHLRSLPTKWHHNNINNITPLKKNYYYYSPCFIKTSSKLDTKCFFMNRKPEDEKGNSLTKVSTETGMHGGVISRSMQNIMKALQLSMMVGVLSGFLFLYDHCLGRHALAASGGSMGGSDFSSSSSSYSSDTSSSSDYSWPSSSEDYSTQIGSPAPIKAKPISRSDAMIMCICIVSIFALCLVINWLTSDQDVAKKSVLKLQVGSLGTGRLLQKDLNRIAKVADTSNSKGFHFVLQESLRALPRHSEYCISGYSSVDLKSSVAECEERFNQLSIEERGKFDEETLVNINNIRKKSANIQSSNGLPNEYIVVTIIVAARGVLELPPLKSSAQLKEALQKLASIPSSNIMAAHVLWTPQKEDDSLTKQEMVEDYPQLHTL